MPSKDWLSQSSNIGHLYIADLGFVSLDSFSLMQLDLSNYTVFDFLY